MLLADDTIRNFRRKIMSVYRKQGRHDLPFRQTTDPYCITVSEIMLQQTQVDRVVPRYERWVSRWPDWAALARVSNRDLLAEWSGLGYNRRALFLGQMAREIAGKYGGEMPDDVKRLLELPGIGRYTARAVLIFAHNRPLAAIDTNIRRVLIHELGLPVGLSPSELEGVALRVLPRRSAREWHYALMDYSSLVLPKQMAHIPPISRQGKFAGSLRQIRGEIVRQLTSKSRVGIETVAKVLNRRESDVVRAARALEKDGIVRCGKRYISLSEPD